MSKRSSLGLARRSQSRRQMTSRRKACSPPFEQQHAAGSRPFSAPAPTRRTPRTGISTSRNMGQAITTGYAGRLSELASSEAPDYFARRAASQCSTGARMQKSARCSRVSARTCSRRFWSQSGERHIQRVGEALVLVGELDFAVELLPKGPHHTCAETASAWLVDGRVTLFGPGHSKTLTVNCPGY